MADKTTYEDLKLVDLTKKLLLIKTVMKQCEKLMTGNIKLLNHEHAAVFLTQESLRTIEKAMKDPKARDLMELHDHHQKVAKEIEESPLKYSHIHNMLYRNYVGKRKLLDINDVTKEFQTGGVNKNVMEILENQGFIWKEIGNDRKCVLVENPEIQAKRIKYFLDMKRFREEKRTIVYIEHKAIPADAATLLKFRSHQELETNDNCGHVKIAASPQIGLMALSINNHEESLIDWFTNDVELELQPSFVLVFEEDIFKEAAIDTPPGPQSMKYEMLSWLERHEIPCNNSMHRANLYKLIELFKDRIDEKKYLKEEMIKAIGVEIVKKPEGWPQLDYFDGIWRMSALWQDIPQGPVDTTIKARLNMAVKCLSLNTWNPYDQILQAKECRLFEQDMELEEVIDKLFTFAKDSPMPDTSLPNVSEVKKTVEEEVLAKFSEKW